MGQKKKLTNLLKHGNQSLKIAITWKFSAARKITPKALASSFGLAGQLPSIPLLVPWAGGGSALNVYPKPVCEGKEVSGMGGPGVRRERTS